MLKFIILLSLGLSIYGEVEIGIDEALPKLSYSDFKEQSKTKDFMAILYDPKCTFCQEAIKNLLDAIIIIKPIAHYINFWRIDVTEDNSIFEEMEVSQVPTIFHKRADDEALNTITYYSKEEYVEAIFKSYFGRIFEVNDAKVGQKILETMKSTLIYIGSIEDEEFGKLNSILNEYDTRGVMVLQISDKSIAKELVLPTKRKLILYTKYNDNYLPYKGEITLNNLQQFLDINKYPPAAKLDTFDMEMLFFDGNPMMVFLSKEKSSASDKIEMMLEDSVNMLRAKNITIRAVIVKDDPDDDTAMGIQEMLGKKYYGTPLVLAFFNLACCHLSFVFQWKS